MLALQFAVAVSLVEYDICLHCAVFSLIACSHEAFTDASRTARYTAAASVPGKNRATRPWPLHRTRGPVMGLASMMLHKLENRYVRKGIGGSNPSPSAI